MGPCKDQHEHDEEHGLVVSLPAFEVCGLGEGEGEEGACEDPAVSEGEE